ncbi:hypothetical protein JCM11641_007500 [Rhodosporidiobolus odoratus]
MSSSSAQPPIDRPSSPPLPASSTLPDTSAPSKARPAALSGREVSPLSDAGSFTPVTTPSTAFTTPGTSSTESLWGRPTNLKVVGKPAQQIPTGFEYLDAAYLKESGQQTSRSFDWVAYTDTSSGATTPTVYKRRLGPTEVSYYLGSRGDGIEGGVNDMYLHLGFKARPTSMQPNRVLDIWTEIVSRHALLGSTVEFNDYYDVRFCYEAPQSASEARIKASNLLDLRTTQDGKALLDVYLNGSRTLSDCRLAYLVISTSAPTFASDSTEEQEYDFLLFSTHFLGDGMALHTTANEFFTLLGGSAESSLASFAHADGKRLAPAMESKLLTPAAWGKLGWSAAQVEFANDQAKLVGGHAFPRAKLGTRKTLVPTISYDAVKTKGILAACKAHGVTIAHAAFALSNIAFIKSVKDKRKNPKLPVMIYSALNVRPYLKKEEVDWYAIAIGYYNIILPSFLPSSLSASAYFWHQALSVKQQTIKAVKTPFLATRTALMALERERRSIGFERADEEKRALDMNKAAEGLQGLGIAVEADGVVEAKEMLEAQALARQEAENAAKAMAELAKKGKDEATVRDKNTRSKAPNTALMGLSMLGNLDGMYKHADFPDIKLHTLTTGSRQRPGALLLFAYTFAGKLWLSLGYDSHGFEEGSIERWWDEMLKGVDDFLLEATPAIAQV